MFYKIIHFDLYKFEKDGNGSADLYNLFNGWRPGYEWTVPCTALIGKHRSPITVFQIFDEELYTLFKLTYWEYFYDEI